MTIRPAADQPYTMVDSYTDPEAEYKHVAAGGVGIVDRQTRGLLEARGNDRAEWLHNLTTNHVKTVEKGLGNYAFCLNQQGRILFDLNTLVRPEALWLDIDQQWLEPSKTHFNKYLIVEDVSLTDLTPAMRRIGMIGQSAADLLTSLGARQVAAMSQLGTTDLTWNDKPVVIMRHDFCGVFGAELFVSTDHGSALWDWLTGEGGGTPIGSIAVDTLRTEAGIPWPGREITDEYVPAETRQIDRAVSFNKGCYLGQEIVARMDSRKSLARCLVGLHLTGNAVPPEGGTLSDASGTAVGTMTSVCHSYAHNGTIALGYVKTAAASPGTKLAMRTDNEEFTVEVEELPFSGTVRT